MSCEVREKLNSAPRVYDQTYTTESNWRTFPERSRLQAPFRVSSDSWSTSRSSNSTPISSRVREKLNYARPVYDQAYTNGIQLRNVPVILLLAGTIPSELGQLVNLKELNLGTNELEGA